MKYGTHHSALHHADSTFASFLEITRGDLLVHHGVIYSRVKPSQNPPQFSIDPVALAAERTRQATLHGVRLGVELLRTN